MIRPRRVVTRRQYERWNRQKQLAESLCNGGGNTPRAQPRSSSTTSQQRGTHHRQLEVPMPLSPLPSDDTNNVEYERLEIYDGADTARPTSLKRRRTPSRVALYRQIDIELEEDESSKSSSTYTDSMGHSNSYSAEMGHSVGDTATLISDQHSDSFISEPPQVVSDAPKVPVKANSCRNNRPSPRHDHREPKKRSNTHNRRKQSDIFRIPIDATLSPASIDVSVPAIGKKETTSNKKNSSGTKFNENDLVVHYTCCDHFTSIFKTAKKKQIERPGMSFSEEQRLWRSILEGVASGVTDENKVVDEIEVVPTENDFKTFGSDNYAESENIGMLFVSTQQYDLNDQHHLSTSSPNNGTPKIPWWKRDQWKFSPQTKTPGSDSHGGVVSRARMSVQTKKISNRTEVPHRQQQQQQKDRRNDEMRTSIQTTSNHEAATTIIPRLSPIRLENYRLNEAPRMNDQRQQSGIVSNRPIIVHDDDEYEEEMMQFHQHNDSTANEPARPFQVYNAKLERRKNIQQHPANTYEMDSDEAMMFPIPHLHSSSINKGQTPHDHPKPTPTIVETVDADSESILTDLSEMVRQVDERQQEEIIIHCEDMSQQHERTTQYKNLMKSNAIDIIADEDDNTPNSFQNSLEENISPVLPPHDNSNCATDDTKQQSNRIWDTRQATSPHVEMKHDKIFLIRPKRDRTKNQNGNATFSDHEPENPTIEVRNHHRDHSISPIRFDDKNQTINRGRRCEDLIDLTNLQEQKGHSMQLRKRSKSPIRLYGDPPLPRHMDGSPIQSGNKKRSATFFERNEAKEVEKCDSPHQVWDEDLLTLKDIFARRDDIADLIAASSPKGNHILPDGSKIVMLKPVVNVYKIRNENEEHPTSPWRNKTNRSNNVESKGRELNNNNPDSPQTKRSSLKKSLQVRTVFSFGENKLAANCGVDPSEFTSSPVVTVSIGDDDSSADKELQQLAASEKLLRKELEEIQKRSAVRRWEIDETIVKVKAHERDRAIDASGDQLRNVNENIESVSKGETFTSSVIDLSCIDIELEGASSLISPLPVASAYQYRNARTTQLREEQQREKFPIRSDNTRQQVRPCESPEEAAITHIPPSPISLDEENGSPFLEVDCASPVDIPMTLSGLSQRLWNLYGRSRTNTERDATNQSPESHGLYVPSLSEHNDNYPSRDFRFFDSNSSPLQNIQPADSNIEYHVESDVFIDKEPSWGTIEKLYQLSLKSESYTSNCLPRATRASFDDRTDERDIEILRRNISPVVNAERSSDEASNSGNTSDPLFHCIEQAESLSASSASSRSSDFAAKSEKSSDRENLTDIDTLDVHTSGGNTVSDQSIYGTLLQLSARSISDKNKTADNSNRQKDPISPRLHSLLVPIKHRSFVEESPACKTNKQSVESNDAKAQGIYAELVRRSRHKNRNTSGQMNVYVDHGDRDCPNVELPKSPIQSVVKRFAWQASPAKRLERLRELHREMNAQQKEIDNEEKESPLTRRLSPARRRATKSLKRNAAVKLPKRDAPHLTPKHSITESNKNVVIQVYMPVTRAKDGELKKLKKDADCRDLISLASSTKSHSLVAALPPAAKARNATSGKPGR